jgi:hypothetical protein
MSKKPKPEPIKRGSRLYGHIYTSPSGRRYYLARRRISEIFRSGEKDISAAIRKGTACWALDEETLIMMRAKGIKVVGVEVRETEDRYFADLAWFFDRKRATVLNYASRGGALQRYLPLSEFRVLPGAVTV